MLVHCRRREYLRSYGIWFSPGIEFPALKCLSNLTKSSTVHLNRFHRKFFPNAISVLWNGVHNFFICWTTFYIIDVVGRVNLIDSWSGLGTAVELHIVRLRVHFLLHLSAGFRFRIFVKDFDEIFTIQIFFRVREYYYFRSYIHIKWYMYWSSTLI